MTGEQKNREPELKEQKAENDEPTTQNCKNLTREDAPVPDKGEEPEHKKSSTERENKPKKIINLTNVFHHQTWNII